MFRRVALASVSVIALAAAASAADIYMPSPAAYKDTPWYPAWAGFYIGANGGYGWSAQGDVFALGTFGGLDPKGGFGGGQIGYNWQGGFGFGPNLVLGIEADIEASGFRDRADFPFVIFKSGLGWFGSVRGRLGYAFGPSLFYATGGFAYGKVANEIKSGSPIPSDAFKNPDIATGYAVGGGWEYKFSPTWSVKAEYQYINLGRNDPILSGFNICPFAAPLKCPDDAYHTVRVGINYHFGTGYVPLE
jgi:outer membrane immunogenic protein